jgi:integrase/recombinase XerD
MRDTYADVLLPKRLPAVNHSPPVVLSDLVAQMKEAYHSWLAKSPSRETRSNYDRDVRQFLAFAGYAPQAHDALPNIRPHHVAAWRDHMTALGLTNASIRRKMTAIRSLFSYLQTYGFVGPNPAHSDFVAAPAVPRDGKTVALSPENCRRFLDAPVTTIVEVQKDGSEKETVIPEGVRDRALLAVLAYTGCRVSELTKLKVESYKQDGVHRVLEIHGKGQKERLVPLHSEAAERIEAWLDTAKIRGDSSGPLFRPLKSARGRGLDGIVARRMSRRAVQKLVKAYVAWLMLDTKVTVHSFRSTALTTARENGSDILDLQAYAGHSDPRTTLSYIRSRDRLSKSPAYVLRY